MNQVQFGGALEQLTRQMHGGAHARRAIAHAGAALARVAHQLGHRFDRCFRFVDHQHVGNRGHQSYVLEVVQAFLAEIAVQAGIDGLRACRAEQQGVAVIGGGRDAAGTDGSVGAGDVLHHDRLAQGLGQTLADQARHDIGIAAGRERHDQLERAIGEAVGSRRQGQAGGAQQRCAQEKLFA